MNKQEIFKRYFPYLITLFGLFAFSMIFFEAFFTLYENILGLTSKKIASYSGLQIALGLVRNENRILPLNFLAILAYLLPLIAGFLAAFKMKYETIKFFSIGVIFTIASILLFILPSLVNIPILFGQTIKFATPPLIAGILSAMASFSSFFYTLKIN